MLLITVCTVYFFDDATASVKIDNKPPFKKKNKGQTKVILNAQLGRDVHWYTMTTNVTNVPDQVLDLLVSD